MSQKQTVYDLGHVSFDPPAMPGRPAQPSRLAQPGRQARHEPAHTRREPTGIRGVPQPRLATRRLPRRAVSGTASLLIPGLGQIVAGEPAAGLFFFSGVGFCAALLWAIASSIDRIVPTLELFGIPAIAAIVVAAVVYAAAAMLHVEGVLHADVLDYESGDRRLPHPLTAGAASFFVPGWGQILAGHRRRAVLFLVCAWLTAGVWLCFSTTATQALGAIGLEPPPALRSGLGLVLLIVLSLVVWSLAVYDAAAGAAMERRDPR